MNRKALETRTEPSTARQFRLPFFYGWLLVGVSFVTMAIGVNARTAFSLLFPQILDEFGWDRGVTAGAFSFGFLVSALVTPCVGWVTDRRGPRLVIETGVVLMGTGLVLATLIREPWQLYLTLGALVGGGVNLLAYTGQSLYLIGIEACSASHHWARELIQLGHDVRLMPAKSSWSSAFRSSAVSRAWPSWLS